MSFLDRVSKKLPWAPRTRIDETAIIDSTGVFWMEFLRRRREFITLLGGAAVTLPRAGFAQPAEKVRRIGIFAGSDENDARARGHVAVFQRELERLGWTQEHNVRIEHRWTSDPERTRQSSQCEGKVRHPGNGSGGECPWITDCRPEGRY